MGYKRRDLPVLGLLLLSVTALACAFTGGGPSILPGGAAPAGDDNVPLSYTAINASGLSSYRGQFVMTFTGTDETGAPVNLTYKIDQSYTANPPASTFVVDAQGSDAFGPVGIMELTQIGDTSYMVSEGQCLGFSGGDTTSAPDTFSPDDFLTGTDFSRAQRVLPNENVNGMMTRHYHFTENEVSLAGSGFTTFSADVWVAVDGGYVVKQVLSGEATGLAFSGATGHVDWTYDLLEVNIPLNIVAPEGCEAPGADVPTMPDATELSAIAGLVTYSTPSTAADVVAFYQTQMPAQGWVPGEASTDTPGLASLSFTREGQTAQILITEAEGKTSVIATVE